MIPTPLDIGKIWMEVTFPWILVAIYSFYVRPHTFDARLHTIILAMDVKLPSGY